MRQLLDTGWQRQGTSWIWDEEARNHVCTASEVYSLRQFLRTSDNWPDDLPSNEGRTLVVAGLEAGLDLLTPQDGEAWLGSTIKGAILSFQSFYEGQAALVFWLPLGNARLSTNTATDAVTWSCEVPYRGTQLDFGRLLWGKPNGYPREILLKEGSKPAGLFHLRIT